MPELVPMPKLGFDMAEGTLVRKVKLDGETVAKGDILAEIETDKATVEVEAYLGGVVRGWLVEEGQAVPIGTPMVIIAAPNEQVDVEALRVQAGAPARPAPPAPQKAAPPSAATAERDAGPGETPAAIQPVAPVTLPGTERPPSSPVARKMATDAGIDIRLIAGTGPGGRVVKKDVEAFLRVPRPAPVPAGPAVPAVPAPALEDQAVPLTRLRQIIGRRMTESKQTVPQFYVTAEVDMAPAMALRKQLNALLPDERKVSVNDFIVKATALALRQFPNVNATFAGDKVIRKGRVNVGIAVALEGGLTTVVVKDADQKPLAQIGVEAKAMGARAREGKVQAADIEGSTFTVSNLGLPVFGEVDHFVAIINPPEAGILAAGAVREVPVVKDGQLVPGLRMKITCSADHRVTDGAEVAKFVQAVRKHLEEPLSLLL